MAFICGRPGGSTELRAGSLRGRGLLLAPRRIHSGCCNVTVWPVSGQGDTSVPQTRFLEIGDVLKARAPPTFTS